MHTLSHHGAQQTISALHMKCEANFANTAKLASQNSEHFFAQDMRSLDCLSLVLTLLARPSVEPKLTIWLEAVIAERARILSRIGPTEHKPDIVKEAESIYRAAAALIEWERYYVEPMVEQKHDKA